MCLFRHFPFYKIKEHEERECFFLLLISLIAFLFKKKKKMLCSVLNLVERPMPQREN